MWLISNKKNEALVSIKDFKIVKDITDPKLLKGSVQQKKI